MSLIMSSTNHEFKNKEFRIIMSTIVSPPPKNKFWERPQYFNHSQPTPKYTSRYVGVANGFSEIRGIAWGKDPPYAGGSHGFDPARTGSICFASH